MIWQVTFRKRGICLKRAILLAICIFYVAILSDFFLQENMTEEQTVHVSTSEL